MPESIYSTSNVKPNIRECDREMILEKKWHGAKPKQTHAEVITIGNFSRCFGHCCSNWGSTATETRTPSSAAHACEDKSPDRDPRLPHVPVETSVLWQQDVPTLAYLCRVVNVLTPPCNGMAWTSLTMKLCATVSQEPHWDGSETELGGYGKDPWELELTPALPVFLSGFT